MNYLNYLSIVAPIVSAIAAMLTVLVHISIGPIEDAIGFVDSWKANAAFHSVEDYNATFGKYGVHIDASTIQMPTIMETLDIARRMTLKTLYETRECRRKLVIVFAIVAAVAGIATVALLNLGF